MATIGSLFTGYGGLDMAVEQVFGAETLWHSDIKPAACKLLAHRFPGRPNLGDITKIDWSRVEPVDIATGGFPCTDISPAGRQAGLIRSGDDKTRSGLWAEMCRAIAALRPRWVVAENVRAITSAKADSDLEFCPWCVGDGAAPDLRALGAVAGDLADIGYDAAWCGLRASDVGAPHGRFRIFVLAWPTDSNGIEVRLQPVGIAGSGPTPLTGQRGLATADTATVGRPSRIDHSVRCCCGACGVGQGDASGGRVGAIADPGASNPAGGPGGTAHVDWGLYELAIRRWERVIGRPAPAPVETGPKGGQRLSPALPEWMMGLPEGWITGVPGLSRSDQLSLAGDGVVPQQAAAALRWLLVNARPEVAV